MQSGHGENGDAVSPHAPVRAIAELAEKFRPSTLRHTVWLVAAGPPYLRPVGAHVSDPRPVWAGNFGCRTALVQKTSVAAEDHGWYLVEVSRKYPEMEEPLGVIPDLDSYADGEDVVIITSLSERVARLEHFGGLLDAGGQHVEENCEPESPHRGPAEISGMDIVGFVLEPALDEGRDEIVGRDVPEFQVIAPAADEDAEAEVVKVNGVDEKPNSSVEILRTAGRFFGATTGGSKRQIVNRIRAAHVSALRLRSLEVARGEYEAMPNLIHDFGMPLRNHQSKSGNFMK